MKVDLSNLYACEYSKYTIHRFNPLRCGMVLSKCSNKVVQLIDERWVQYHIHNVIGYADSIENVVEDDRS